MLKHLDLATKNTLIESLCRDLFILNPERQLTDETVMTELRDRVSRRSNGDTVTAFSRYLYLVNVSLSKKSASLRQCFQSGQQQQRLSKRIAAFNNHMRNLLVQLLETKKDKLRQELSISIQEHFPEAFYYYR